MSNNANNHMKSHNPNSKILKFLKENRVVTSSEIAKFLGVSWNTADKYLLELALDKKLERIKKQEGYGYGYDDEGYGY